MHVRDPESTYPSKVIAMKMIAPARSPEIMSRPRAPRRHQLGRRGGTRHAGLLVAWAAAAALAAASTGCGATPPAPPPGFDPAALPVDAPLTAIPTDSGNLQLSLWTSPQPPVKGLNEALYRVVDSSSQPVDGLTIGVVPFMPSHGHGSAATAEVMPLGAGYYLVTPVYLTMSGPWQLRTSIDGADHDAVIPVVDIP